ncbi:GNAT family N-acetyltransferase [Lysobacter sp. S4-A87]|uniref:GNAT family N-acetyltransferase n=1 Tax=Lysobacter sp. S4-A87 TaxID=2925843 RepID=UPI001F53049A|nr:GNAT family N-acetyltransferase [Lysobacter sp. S4-A87]UNK49827.1 GNAT family N-acetyltransferase [Lysobacter sp. S4-A87]
MNMQPPIAAEGSEQAFPRWLETLRDRTKVLIRPIDVHDKQAEREFIEGLSDEARRFRFLGQVRSPSEAFLKQLTDIDYVHQVAFVAVANEDDRERIVGVSRYCTDATGAHSECAVTVDEHWQHKGLGTVLMRHLIAVAKSRGVRTMFSIDSAENAPMRELATFLGFRSRLDPDEASQVIHELDLTGAEKR